MNVFEHQSFRLRKPPTPEHPLGEQVRRSYREIMTGANEDLRFDYPLEYFNVAALGLCIALTQALFEPEDSLELLKRLDTPIDETRFEQAIASLRDTFSIDGKVRFMQGPKLEGKKPGDLSELILSIKKGDKEFLNRPSDGAVVALDQIPLLLFSRSTYFEKSAGRGYLTGTSGDLEIRTYLIDPTSLRRTIWLNVLAQDQQGEHYSPIGARSGYDKWMWQSPPSDDVAQGNCSLRSGLLWMVANAFIEIEPIETPRQCIVTGELEAAGVRAGTGVMVSPTGKGYGVKVAREKGPEVRMSFFRHPNGPSQTIEPTKGTPFTRHLMVSENSGLIGQMAGLFFASPEFGGKGYHLAPVVSQLYSLNIILKRELRKAPLRSLQLLCFGFHMLSSKQNVHGGYESELFDYPILGERDPDASRALKEAEELMSFAAKRTGEIEWPLKRAIQLCTLTQIDTSVSDKEQGRQEFKEKSRIDEGGMISDSAVELWRHAGIELRELIDRISEHGDSADALSNALPELRLWWTKRIAAAATTIFYRTFNSYSTSPTHMIAAFNARKLFHISLHKIDSGISATANTPQPEETAS